MQDDDIRNMTGIPGLMNIPILGELFKSRTNTKEKTEIFVLVTPTILDDSGKMALAPVVNANNPPPAQPSPEKGSVTP